MSIYKTKRKWKWWLFFAALVIVAASLVYTNMLVRKIAKDERQKVKIWAEAIQRKASLVNYTNNFFNKIRIEERKRVEIWAEATRRSIIADPDEEDLSLYDQIISQTTNIPLIWTDENGKILAGRNLDFKLNTNDILEGNLKRQFTEYDPIIIDVYGLKQYIYYKESKVYTELRERLDDLIESFFSDIVNNTSSVPVIIQEATSSDILAMGNVDTLKYNDSTSIFELLQEMEVENDPILVDLPGKGQQIIYYKESYLLTQLRYYPVVQFGIIGIFLLISYLLFSFARRSEQNQVWVGMAKETAHQLGTPLSSMMAWVELLKLENTPPELITEVQKDIDRLNTITTRFSKIGSVPELDSWNIAEVMDEIIDYLQTRTSRKVHFLNQIPASPPYKVALNKELFHWVIENLVKNAVDAMGSKGSIRFDAGYSGTQVFIDVSDTGKGMTRTEFKNIFNPGYTSKKRGWGLGLTLSRRIIEQYHNGKIFVKSSAPKQGTTFRILLNQPKL